jgi:hypothetical protein
MLIKDLNLKKFIDILLFKIISEEKKNNSKILDFSMKVILHPINKNHEILFFFVFIDN